MIQAWLQEKHNGHSKAVNLGRRSEIEGQILRACQWASQRPAINVYEPYPLTTRLLKRLEWLYQKTGKLWTIEALEKANTDRSLEASVSSRLKQHLLKRQAENAQQNFLL